MCSSKSSQHQHQHQHQHQQTSSNLITTTTTIAKLNGRPVLQPKSNQFPILERRNSLKKNPTTAPTSNAIATPNKTKNPSSNLSPPISPKLKSPRPAAVKRGSDPNYSLNASSDKVVVVGPLPPSPTKLATTVKKSKKSCNLEANCDLKFCSPPSIVADAPGSIAAARREQVATMQKERKLRTAHYGRTNNSAKKVAPVDPQSPVTTVGKEEKRCSFITANSDPIYVAYHDEEWGVVVHDDKLLFELLVLTGAQVGSDWASVLRKREAFRKAFSGFDAEIVAKFNEKKMTSISAEYGIDMSQVRGVVDNSIRILAVQKEFGSFDKYLWGYVNNKPINTQYKSCQKIPVKTSKSETISKDMVKRGFRLVGPTVIHSFMQAAGLSNDHLISCPRHHQCTILSSQN